MCPCFPGYAAYQDRRLSSRSSSSASTKSTRGGGDVSNSAALVVAVRPASVCVVALNNDKQNVSAEQPQGLDTAAGSHCGSLDDDDDDEATMTPSSPLIGGRIGGERGDGTSPMRLSRSRKRLTSPVRLTRKMGRMVPHVSSGSAHHEEDLDSSTGGAVAVAAAAGNDRPPMAGASTTAVRRMRSHRSSGREEYSGDYWKKHHDGMRTHCVLKHLFGLRAIANHSTSKRTWERDVQSRMNRTTFGFP